MAVDAKPGMAGSATAASSGQEGMVATVEYIQKVTQDEVGRLEVSMNAEWKPALTVAGAGALLSPISAKEDPYWSEERAPKLRRLQSEPTSPPLRQPQISS